MSVPVIIPRGLFAFSFSMLLQLSIILITVCYSNKGELLKRKKNEKKWRSIILTSKQSCCENAVQDSSVAPDKLSNRCPANSNMDSAEHFCQPGSNFMTMCAVGVTEANYTLKFEQPEYPDWDTSVEISFQTTSKCGSDTICKKHISHLFVLQTNQFVDNVDLPKQIL